MFQYSFVFRQLTFRVAPLRSCNSFAPSRSSFRSPRSEFPVCGYCLQFSTAQDEGGKQSRPGDGGDDGLGARNGESTKRPTIPLCQVNNHPDFRLRQARARLQQGLGVNIRGEASSESGRTAPMSFHALENPTRSSDGTSSGALAEERLRRARRNAMENMALKDEQGHIDADSPTAPTPSSNDRGSYNMIENPVRSSDGTSSGARAADRLRQARRKAFQSMKQENTSSSSSSIERCHNADPIRSNIVAKENGLLHKTAYENPVRPNDGMSSGALVADRLRMARRMALASVESCPPSKYGAKAKRPLANPKPKRAVRQHGLAISMYQNRVKSNDGTSSGARAESRLQMARRNALERMSKPSPTD
ncbi:hypothetical protein ACHAWF_000981 [Thalassiosira exigua]